MSFSPPPPRVSPPPPRVSPPPPPRVSPPPFVFKGIPLSEYSAEIYSVISQLSSSSLTPHELWIELINPRRRIPLGIDLNDLGHAYYSHYWQPHVQKKQSASSKLKFRSDQIKEAVEVPNATAPQDEHADSTCNQEYGPNFIMSPAVFTQALRTINPRELKSGYYHHRSICGTEFNVFLEHMNQIIRAYFETPAYAVGHEMNQLLNGIIKCTCLRILSRSAYHYAHGAKCEVNDDAMKHLLEFYKLNDLIHAWDDSRFISHAHMIRKYDVLKMFIARLLDLGPSFLSTHYFTFSEVTNNLELVLFDDLYGEPAYFACESFPHCITDLKRNISADDILHSLQRLSESPNKEIVDAGLTLLQFLAHRIKQDNALSRDTKDDYDVVHSVFQMTGEAIDQLPVATHPHEHALFLNIGNEIIAMTRFMNSKRKRVYSLRMHSSPFQALIISPRIFRARNIPSGYGSVSVHRASPPPVLRASPPPVLRVSPPPVLRVPPPVLRVSPPVRHGFHHGFHHGSNTKKRSRGGAKSKTRRSKR